MEHSCSNKRLKVNQFSLSLFVTCALELLRTTDVSKIENMSQKCKPLAVSEPNQAGKNQHEETY